jgi:hypothetical protein
MGILAEYAARLPPEDPPLDPPTHSDKLTDVQASWLVWFMREARGTFDGLRSHPFTEQSGAAQSVLHDCAYRVYSAVWQGIELEAAIAEQAERYRGIAAEQQRKVDQAPRIRFAGGSKGGSHAEHLWISPDAFDDLVTLRIRKNVAHALAQTVEPVS